LGKTLLGSLPKGVKLEEFKLPRLIFDFLDSFYPGNSKRILKILHELVVKEPPEFIFALLAKHLRDLFWVTTNNPLPYPPWRVSKLKAQAVKFKKEDLKTLIEELSEIDIKVKTSEAELTPSLDLLIVRQLQ
jgi:DNA polymerase III delta subunit